MKIERHKNIKVLKFIFKNNNDSISELIEESLFFHAGEHKSKKMKKF
jgi:hypothetical protein